MLKFDKVKFVYIINILCMWLIYDLKFIYNGICYWIIILLIF